MFLERYHLNNHTSFFFKKKFNLAIFFSFGGISHHNAVIFLAESYAVGSAQCADIGERHGNRKTGMCSNNVV